MLRRVLFSKEAGLLFFLEGCSLVGARKKETHVGSDVANPQLSGVDAQTVDGGLRARAKRGKSLPYIAKLKNRIYRKKTSKPDLGKRANVKLSTVGKGKGVPESDGGKARNPED